MRLWGYAAAPDRRCFDWRRVDFSEESGPVFQMNQPQRRAKYLFRGRGRHCNPQNAYFVILLFNFIYGCCKFAILTVIAQSLYRLDY
jgi:hypothetical protein